VSGLFASRDYRLWWSGNLVSSVGSAMSLVAIPLLVLLVTHSPVQVGIVGALEAVPFALFALPVGVLADRLPRRGILAGAAIVSVVSMGSIPLAYHFGALTIGQLYAVAVLNGVAGLATDVTKFAVIPRIVPEEQLGPASAQFEIVWNVSAVLGPALAGLLMTQVWPALPMLVDAVSFGVVAVTVMGIRAQLSSPRPPEPAPWRTDLTLGARRVWADRRLRAMTLLTITGDLLFAGITVLMTVLVRSTGASATWVGLVFTFAAVGGVIGSLAASRVQQRFGLVTSIVVRSWVTAVLFPLLALQVVPAVIGVVWAAINITIALMNVVQMQYVMTCMPEEILGRVQSFMTLMAYAVLPAGTMLTGVLLQETSPHVTVLVFAGVLLLMAVYSSVSRDLRSQGEQSGTPEVAAEVR
jgi:MFS family permease